MHIDDVVVIDFVDHQVVKFTDVYLDQKVLDCDHMSSWYMELMLKAKRNERVDVTVGSALDIFGGSLAYKDVVAWHARQEALAV
ncbi:hypothetical protein Leryth_002455 [Lithospermum erythrorhizon]|nr:hypothetical protein Leryth_002455 [Lithospermum erythrorhizon]